ncbi:protein-L-isoaspartate(D-aspartate) O-methyltransferase [Methanospirillum hungatei]|jgi:protein-L-isoaspartate(D-aspartate) O-methyltransferase|uniref:protein-L-isoaspartate(D-aspartate) O-methyltransferase n=1 Tax=Methanospirillum hungatei TaxID=2203 RepID=UPI0009D4E9D3|nr:protein-L-isoaspartate(D-aspartate) O-methyltransferase [Methanospirillum hungatei]MBP7034401.1 protein-L-isoaspartate(D-aspartate) O-methyltransferase [Methanospirillum sp.]MBP9007918.1 protein-L-isoaspartate(D-aspartate) O-methyltransferase [Methanospirillum sp.]OQA59559.1 MAG: Protein-L-isoaspartate O-methyltransferase [Euryarchaeota archaeon ADurb.Bin294]HOW04713.1 protein-L-isoaspartate(D-aspartate) O-methyltransferase [Methanospirillum hungatei]
MESRLTEREEMVRWQIEARGVKNPRVLQAMRSVPRHLFVPEPYAREAYQDYPLPIGNDQTISQPYIVAVMTELLSPENGDLILEIGTGSGYQAAILVACGASVISIERIPAVADLAKRNLTRAGIRNVLVLCQDGTLGYAEKAPYNGILITAATPALPEPLLEELADGGRLVAPVGDRDIQELTRVTRNKDEYHTERFGAVRFVPLIGMYGWKKEW